MKRMWLSAVVMAVAVFVGATTVRTQGQSQNKTTLYLIATAHLDSQWNWTVQDSIRDYIPKTFNTNFEYFEKYPDYKFSWEGAIHYMWFKEYHPDQWATLQKYVAADRWRLAGSWIDAVDPNMPSPESLFRQALYAQRFFRQEFNKEPHDVYLPDCFGFGFSLPSIAVASGLNSFSTQKLTWGRAIPFPIGRWKGVDGSELIVGLNPGSYGSNISEPITLTSTNGRQGTNTTPWLNDPTPIGGGRQIEFRYFGTGDTGGGPSEASVANVQKSIKDPAQQIDIRNTSPDQMAKDLTPEQKAMLPEYNSELILKTHGTGCYTSQAAMKRFNRVNELLADEAERAGVAAEYLTGLAYPTERLRDAWVRFIWHQFHDDLTGTCIPQAYQFSWNDEIASMNQFAGVLTSSTRAVSSLLDTSPSGAVAPSSMSIPLVVYNPLSMDRREPVEATVTFTGLAPGAVRVTDASNGRDVPAQIVSASGSEAHIVFLADAPSVGYKVYHVSAAAAALGDPSSLRVTANSLENNRISVKIDQNGDISSIFDKDAKHELLKAPIMLEMRDNPSGAWPAWEVLYETVQSPAREFVSRPSVKVIESGPVRIGIEITRKASGSTFVQRVRLAEGGDRVEVENLVDWRSPNTELKASFPFTASNPKAVYDLGVGTIERTNNEPEKYEVPAQKWADIDDASGAYGIGIINDSKYGWDKPDNGTLRLTLLHTPKPVGGYTYQSSNDLGQHRFVYAIAGHSGDWRQGRMPTKAWQVNQPLVAFQTTAHAGVVGRSFSMAQLTTAPPSGQELPVRDTAGQVSIVALKKAEDSDEYIVRLQERYGLPAVTTLRFAGNILSAREVNAAEEEIGPIALAGGGGRGNRGGGAGAAPAVPTFPSVAITMKPYQPKTIAVRLQSPWDATTAFRAAQAAAAAAAAANPNAGRGGGGGGGRGNATPPPDVPAPQPMAAATVDLPFNLDGVSSDANRADGDFDGKGHTLSAELLPSTLTLEGVPFKFGSSAPGAKNVVVAKGQTIALPAGAYNRVYVIAAAVGGDVNASFSVGGAANNVTVREWQGPVGQWWSRLKDIAPSLHEPFAVQNGGGANSGLVVSWDPRTGEVSGIDQIRPGFVKRDLIAWVGGHRHDPKDNEPYVSSYLFEYTIDLPAGARAITLPSNDNVRIMAVSVAASRPAVTPAGALYIPDITAQSPKIPPVPPAIKK